MRLRLKRQYLVLFTILLTIITGFMIQLVVVRANQIKTEIAQCDEVEKHTCTISEINSYLR